MMKKAGAVLVVAGLLSAAAASLSGCAGSAVGAGASAGVAVLEERTFGQQAKDAKIHVQIIAAWLNFNESMPLKLGAEVFEGRALLTGVALGSDMRADAVRLAWTVEGIREVINEIQIGGGGAAVLAQDSWITAQLTSKITFDENVSAVNYVIETVNGTVYLIGIAQSQQELDRVIGHARTIGYVRDIISHVRVKGAP